MSSAMLNKVRIVAGVVLALCIGVSVFQDGVSASTVVLVSLGAIWGSSAHLIDARLSRPAKTYAYLALASSIAAALFIGVPAWDHDNPTIGIIGWAGVTILGLIWCIYYERTATAR